VGEADAVRECLALHGPLVWSMARRWLRDPAQAEDLVQEVFIQVWRSAASYDPTVASERTWIATITRRRMIDQRRKQAAAPVTEELELAAGGGTAEDALLESAILREEATVARLAMQQLKPDQRRLLVLSVFEGLSHGEISTRTNLPLGTVKTHLRAGLARLRSLLHAERARSAGEGTA